MILTTKEKKMIDEHVKNEGYQPKRTYEAGCQPQLKPSDKPFLQTNGYKPTRSSGAGQQQGTPPKKT